MEKKESKKVQDIKNPTFENKKLKASRNSNIYKDKPLPWWVELLFVQIGLPDKWLIKILNSKKNITELIKNEKWFIRVHIDKQLENEKQWRQALTRNTFCSAKDGIDYTCTSLRHAQ